MTMCGSRNRSAGHEVSRKYKCDGAYRFATVRLGTYQKTASDGTANEGRERQKWSRDRIPAGPSEGQSDEDEVAGHVGDEDTVQAQNGDGVDDAGYHREEYQQPG